MCEARSSQVWNKLSFVQPVRTSCEYFRWGNERGGSICVSFLANDVLKTKEQIQLIFFPDFVLKMKGLEVIDQ